MRFEFGLADQVRLHFISIITKIRKSSVAISLEDGSSREGVCTLSTEHHMMAIR